MCNKLFFLISFVLVFSMVAAGTAIAAVQDTAGSDTAVSGTVTNDYTDTQSSNDTYESIEEVVTTTGPPNNRYSYLEHKWTINVAGGDPVTFYVEAYHTSNSEDDDFVFAYSTNIDSGYTNMLTVTKTSDDDANQSYALPNGTSGNIYIRVKDADQTAGNKTLDTVYIDHMYIESAGGGGPSDPNLIAIWNFDDNTADDSSGNNHDGTFVNGATTVYDSDIGSNVLVCDGDNDYVNCGSGTWADLSDTMTAACWVKADGFWVVHECIFTKFSSWQFYRYWNGSGIRLYTDGTTDIDIDYDNVVDHPTTAVDDNKWHHIAATFDAVAGERRLYVDGELAAEESVSGSLATSTYDIAIGRRMWETYQNYYDGKVDDARLYDKALSQDEVREIGDFHDAYDAYPASGSGGVATDVILSWKPGDKVASTQGHDVYFGTNYILVAGGDNSVSIGTQDGNSYAPTLASGTTYYWAVDEVNGGSTWSGKISAFTTESEGFYKDLFMDCGTQLDKWHNSPGAGLMGLTTELFWTEDTSTQSSIMISSTDDDNGDLLYPDGEPRFRLIWSAGGWSVGHADDLGSAGKARINSFYDNGGSFTGSCAGAFIAAVGYENTTPANYYGIWPAYWKESGLADTYTGIDVPSGSKLLDYFDLGGDNYLTAVYHNGGGYAIEDDVKFWCTGTENLAIYDYPTKAMDDDAAIIAYKEDSNSGRILVGQSHPEVEEYGENRECWAASFHYALAGQGQRNVKAALSNASTRNMTDNGTAGYEKIGDKQYHHFTIDVPASTASLTITLDGGDGNDLNLYAKQGGFAVKGESGVTAATNGSGADETLVITSPASGTWYIGVKCNTTVTSTYTVDGNDIYYAYTGNTNVLNGVPYTINATYPAAAVTVTESSGSTDVAEEGTTTDTYTVVLNSLPTATVTIAVDPDVDTEVNNNGAGNSINLTFLTTNWDDEQTVTVKAIDDGDTEGNHTSTITHNASSSDNDYDGISIDSVVANVTDNDGDPNLVAWYTFDDETANDSSGNTLHGTLINNGGGNSVGFAYNEAMDSNVLDLVNADGTTQSHVDCGNNSALDITGDITLACWVYLPNGWDGGEQHILMKGLGYGLHRYASISASSFYLWGTDSTYYIPNASTSVEGNVWHHVAATYDASTGWRKLYIDSSVDVEQQITPQTFNSSTVHLSIGGRFDTLTAQGFHGHIDDVRIYNKALNSTEISSVMNEQSPKKLPWSDGFEGGDFAGGWTTQNGDATVSSQVEYSGVYGVKLKKSTWIEKAISTEGFSTIHVKYRRETAGFDSGENIYIEWSVNGNDWYNLETVQTASYSDGLQDKTCASGADDNSGFRVRFRTNASHNNESGKVDDIEITGTAN